jgi:hypothetical protein
MNEHTQFLADTEFEECMFLWEDVLKNVPTSVGTDREKVINTGWLR